MFQVLVVPHLPLSMCPTVRTEWNTPLKCCAVLRQFSIRHWRNIGPTSQQVGPILCQSLMSHIHGLFFPGLLLG